MHVFTDLHLDISACYFSVYGLLLNDRQRFIRAIHDVHYIHLLKRHWFVLLSRRLRDFFWRWHSCNFPYFKRVKLAVVCTFFFLRNIEILLDRMTLCYMLSFLTFQILNCLRHTFRFYFGQVSHIFLDGLEFFSKDIECCIFTGRADNMMVIHLYNK